ncbi:MAG: hypothetical protein IPJ86_15605 [Bacteroidetes bacterium]|nr:hypothetical protein [Bacteroidota bacterium]MBK9317640.1 hypothetical protein [Bacteroidota bacterium]
MAGETVVMTGRDLSPTEYAVSVMTGRDLSLEAGDRSRPVITTPTPD